MCIFSLTNVTSALVSSQLPYQLINTPNRISTVHICCIPRKSIILILYQHCYFGSFSCLRSLTCALINPVFLPKLVRSQYSATALVFVDSGLPTPTTFFPMKDRHHTLEVDPKLRELTQGAEELIFPNSQSKRVPTPFPAEGRNTDTYTEVQPEHQRARRPRKPKRFFHVPVPTSNYTAPEILLQQHAELLESIKYDTFMDTSTTDRYGKWDTSLSLHNSANTSRDSKNSKNSGTSRNSTTSGQKEGDTSERADWEAERGVAREPRGMELYRNLVERAKNRRNGRKSA